MISSRTTLLIIAATLLLVCVFATLLLIHTNNQRALLNRTLTLVRQLSVVTEAETSGFFITDFVVLFGTFLARSGILPTKTLDELEATLSSSSLTGKNGLALFLGSKVLLASIMLIISFLALGHFGLSVKLHYIGSAVSSVVGLIIPDYVIGRIRKRYLDAVAKAVPDALDLLVICSEAGLGLEPAIARVGEELTQAHPEMARELRLTSHELQLASDRREALTNMGSRTQLDSLRRLASTLIQTMQFGTPLTHALRTLASEMRQEQMTQYEGRAAKLPVMLTIPMILFILPCVFIVVGGPAALKVMGLLSKN